ncbi:MAG: hypothetical protein IK092_02900, partial [Muribaculaceae bacterium]|nr:hypothetical protein [Muribaculaceae bacterium]
MRKLLLTTVAIALSLVKGYAIPAAPYPVVLTQPDGTTIETHINGDEFYDFRTTADGYTIVQNADGYYVYAQKQNGKLVPTSVVARNADERSAAERAWLKNLGKRLIDDRNVINAKKARSNRTAAMRAPGFDYNNFRGLVILVEWSDVKFQRSDPLEFFSDMIKKRNYTGFTNEDGSRNAYGTYTG